MIKMVCYLFYVNGLINTFVNVLAEILSTLMYVHSQCMKAQRICFGKKKKGQDEVYLGLLAFPGAWVSLCLPFLNLPEAVHLLLSSLHNWGRGRWGSRMSLLWTGSGGELGKWRKQAVVVRQGLWKGRLQGSPAPRQMCLGVTPHARPNESPGQMFNVKAGLSRRPRHARAPTSRCKDMHARSTNYHYIRMWLREGSDDHVHLDVTLTTKKAEIRIGLNLETFFCKSAINTHNALTKIQFCSNSLSLMKCFYRIMYFQTLFDLCLVAFWHNLSILKDFLENSTSILPHNSFLLWDLSWQYEDILSRQISTDILHTDGVLF